MQTIAFMPDRLNAEPVVFRGFTTPELGLAALAGAALGLVPGIACSFLWGWVTIPTGVLLMPLVVVFFGGRIMTRLKRGKPENYIWQRLALRRTLAGLGDLLTITTSGHWSLKRSGRPS
jgi:conjugative transfer region protein (TIGR03750 family)